MRSLRPFAMTSCCSAPSSVETCAIGSSGPMTPWCQTSEDRHLFPAFAGTGFHRWYRCDECTLGVRPRGARPSWQRPAPFRCFRRGRVLPKNRFQEEQRPVVRGRNLSVRFPRLSRASGPSFPLWRTARAYGSNDHAASDARASARFGRRSLARSRPPATGPRVSLWPPRSQLSRHRG